jgi:hypothetical protein
MRAWKEFCIIDIKVIWFFRWNFTPLYKLHTVRFLSEKDGPTGFYGSGFFFCDDLFRMQLTYLEAIYKFVEFLWSY